MKKKLIHGLSHDRELIHKIWLTMRLVVFLFFISLVHVSASVYSQKTKLNLKVENATLQQVFELIQNQSEFDFFYKNEQIPVEKRVSIDAKNETIESILNNILKDTDLKFGLVDKDIVIIPNEPANAQRQKKSLSGKVTDASGATLPGVSVVLKGTTLGVITDNNGFYSIANVPENASLVFTFVGMKSQEVKVGNQTTINIKLLDESVGVDEVVVVGYGTQKKINLTGSVGVITNKALENRPLSDVSQALQGTVANLNVSTTARGGELGENRSWNIRGMGSLSGGQPYILVDNVPMNMQDVNPNDIESVSVLKDAASSAIYGARAAFGVVLITTKKGSKNKEIKMDYSSNFSFNSPVSLPHMANSTDFATMWNTAYTNAGRVPYFNATQLDLIKKWAADPNSVPSNQRYPTTSASYMKWGANNYANGNTDWPSVWYKNNALSQTHNISIYGGTNKTSFYVSGGYNDQDGLLAWGNDNLKKFNLNVRLETEVTNWFKFKWDSKYSVRERQFPNLNFESNNGKGYLYTLISTCWPTTPVYDPNGHLFARNQLMGMLQGGTKDSWNTSWNTLGGEFTMSKGWKAFIDYSFNSESYKYFNHQPTIYGYLVDNTTYVAYGNPNKVSEQFSINKYHTVNAYSTYEKTLGSHNLKALVGYQEELTNYSSLSGSNSNLITDAIPSISTSTNPVPSVSDAISHWATQSYFGRLNYNFKEKFMVEANIRFDGTSRFQEGKRWGGFPSASVGYRISEEPFWKNIKSKVNDFKIRGSYGKLGNQDVANYLYLSTIPMGTNLPYFINAGRPNYTQAPGLISSGLTWETSATLDFGLDAAFLNNRLNLNFDWYNRTTTNMFGPAEALPSVIGTSVPRKNNAELETKGFELNLSWRDKLSNGLSYDLTFILSDNLTKVTSYNNPTKILSTYYEGQKLGEIWGYTSGGLFATDAEAAASTASVSQSYLYSRWQAGDMKYIDLNKDGKINIGDNTLTNPGDLSVIGNSTPRFAYGIKGGVNWKGFDFSMFWQGVGKRDLAFGGNQMFGIQNDEWNSSAFVQHLDYWTPENTGAYYPKPYMSTEHNKNIQTQTRYLLDGSYIRLKNIQLGYTIPAGILKKIRISKINLYVSGENLLTYSKLPKQFDPEVSIGDWGIAGRTYPMTKSISFGTKITF